MRRFLDSDLAWRFRRSPIAIIALVAALLMAAGAILAPLIAPQDPFDAASLDLMNSLIPPAFEADGDAQFPLGTDDQGRDLFSAILYGTRISLLVGVAGVALAMLIGVTLGLVAGYRGGWVGAVIMRIADVQLTFPAILIALLINGIALALVGKGGGTDVQIGVIVVAIGLSYWVQYARTVRGSTLVESRKEYVQAARLIGLSDWTIMFRHVLPNVMGPVLVIATINLALAIITEATLSFLGVGVPSTSPSLGTLINIGNRFLFSGEWWITIFPGAALAVLALSVNLLGDWLRDALNPKLR
ncbi:ABC transporter permease [Mycobacterium sp. KBS0706]|uniref:ABC transporter permease n=1 Tax=Mycobacterium sp. KBS0706 TaxID=2578109 RepID=UPI00110F7077|nr:ABC transporter permease [Mycobacterium sp. KBS0706]TSD83202.1 ABC transporter permease [Mycobacterium sp. KBS0706]